MVADCSSRKMVMYGVEEVWRCKKLWKKARGELVAQCDSAKRIEGKCFSLLAHGFIVL